MTYIGISNYWDSLEKLFAQIDIEFEAPMPHYSFHQHKIMCSLTIVLNFVQNGGSRYYFMYNFSCTDDIPQADLVKTLLKDVWDIRTAKLRKSIDQMVAKQERHAQVSLPFHFHSIFSQLEVHDLISANVCQICGNMSLEEFQGQFVKNNTHDRFDKG